VTRIKQRLSAVDRQTLLCALRLERLMDERRPGIAGEVRDLACRAEPVMQEAASLRRTLELARHAVARGWRIAAAHAQELAHARLDRLRQLLDESQPHSFSSASQRRRRPSARDLFDDLRQLHDEFEQVSIEMSARDGDASVSDRDSIKVVTEPIELEDVHLGPFEIVLQLHRLRYHADPSAFRVIALDPNPAGGNELVTHPHVNDEGLCAGEAAAPIASALADGRLCDAFLAVHAVLNTYNPSSPFVPLDQWSGSTCYDCGTSLSSDDRCFCEGCGQEFCDECSGHCDVCEEIRCYQCLTRDEVSERWCCRQCRRRCNDCRRIVDADSFDDDSALCPECLAKLESQPEQEEQPPDESTDQPIQRQESIHEHPNSELGEASNEEEGERAAPEQAAAEAAVTGTS
jgi:hypothetical protein